MTKGYVMMQAVVINKTGSVDVLEVQDLPMPTECAADELLIKVMAAGVNPVDTKLRKGGLFFTDAYPAILGCDGAGYVEKIGADVEGFQLGDAVYYCYGGLGMRSTAGDSVGNYAEYAVVKAAFVAQKPVVLDFDAAAAAPLVLITAWEALFDRANIHAGQTVFVSAGAGGVGHVAIQLAKLAGAQVATSVSSDEKAEFVRELGADLIINYKTQDVSKVLLDWSDGSGVDIILDTVGGESIKALLPALAIYGDLVTLLQLPDDLDWKTLRNKNARISQTLMLTPMAQGNQTLGAEQATILEQCGQLIDENKLFIYVDETYPLADVQKAHAQLEEGHQSGKVVLQMFLEEDESGDSDAL